jgi:FkbM family methyltransferase
MEIIKQIRWKFLLGVFKAKRIVKRWYGSRLLDYKKSDIYMLTDTLREYETRARSVVKEPRTVEWIEEKGEEGAVFYDIGANVGAYSLIAATRGMKVVAFEPAYQNILKVSENALVNKLNENIIVVPIMLSNQNGVASSHIKDRSFGATHSFSFDEIGLNPLPKQYFLAIRLDSCKEVFSLPEPVMMKIDVDGAEFEILKGAEKLLKSDTLRHILIETEDSNKAIVDYIESFDFKLCDQDASGKDFVNYIFER